MMHSIIMYYFGIPSGESRARVWWSQKCSFFSSVPPPPPHPSPLSLHSGHMGSATCCASLRVVVLFSCVFMLKMGGLVSKMKKLCVYSSTSPIIGDLVTFSFPKLFPLSSIRPQSCSTKPADHFQLVRMIFYHNRVHCLWWSHLRVPYMFQNSDSGGWESTFASVSHSSYLRDLPSGCPAHNDTAVLYGWLQLPAESPWCNSASSIRLCFSSVMQTSQSNQRLWNHLR